LEIKNSISRLETGKVVSNLDFFALLHISKTEIERSFSKTDFTCFRGWLLFVLLECLFFKVFGHYWREFYRLLAKEEPYVES